MSAVSRTALVYSRTGDPTKVLALKKASVPLYTKSAAINETLGAPTNEGTSVLVKILAAPLNPSDFNMVQGNYARRAETLPAVGGNECVGRVVNIGNQVNGLSPGDLVVPAAAGLGTWRSEVLTDQDKWLPLCRNDVPIHLAATLNVNPCTAYRMLHDFVQLQPGDIILQNGGNSAVGEAVLQIARARGIKTVSIIRDRDDFEELSNFLTSLGADLIVAESQLKTAETRQKILSMSNGKPIRLALNCVGGDSALELARLLDDGGVHVTYGAMSKQPFSVPATLLIFKDIRFVGFWMTRWYDQESNAGTQSTRILNARCSVAREEMMNYIINLMATGRWVSRIIPRPVETDWLDAVQCALNGFGKGKQMLVFE